jgi:hypothetical protein
MLAARLFTNRGTLSALSFPKSLEVRPPNCTGAPSTSPHLTREERGDPVSATAQTNVPM